MSKPQSYLLKGGTLVTMDSQRKVLHGDLRISDNFITHIGPNLEQQSEDNVISVQDHFVIPGLIQVHTHLCQILFRGMADDLALLDWLQKKIWPLESSHNQSSMEASARLGLMEMQMLGTTSILDMASTRETDAIFAAVEDSGMRYWGGNCLADLKSTSGPLYMDTQSSIQESERLIKTWHQKKPLIEYALCPRFAVSCTEEILHASVAMQSEHNILIHTHASENKDELELIRKRTGHSNVDFLYSLGLLSPNSVIVHGVHLTEGEIHKIAKTNTKLAHCPSSNLKLASGIAPITHYHKAGITIGLGADGAPCNNTMDPFFEMRLAALIQKPKFGPKSIPAQKAFEMATLGGAQVLGRKQDLGSLEKGKLADVVVVRRDHPSVSTVEDPYSALVYSCSGRDVRHVFIHGRQVVQDSKPINFDYNQVIAQAKQELKSLIQRANV